MTSEDGLKLLLSKLDECGIPYMITGSFASNIHGLPRATQDADIVIEVEQKTLERFLKSLGSAFYRSPEAAMDALGREQMFNVIHLPTGFKVDLIVRKSRPFSKMEPDVKNVKKIINKPSNHLVLFIGHPLYSLLYHFHDFKGYRIYHFQKLLFAEYSFLHK